MISKLLKVEKISRRGKTKLAIAALALAVSPLLRSSAFGASVNVSTGTAAWYVTPSTNVLSSNPFPPNGPIVVSPTTLVSATTLVPNPNWTAVVPGGLWIGPDAAASVADPVGVYVYQLAMSVTVGHTYVLTGLGGSGSASVSTDNNFLGPDQTAPDYGDAYLTTGSGTVLTPITSSTAPPVAGTNNIQDFTLTFTVIPVGDPDATTTTDYLDFVVNNGQISPGVNTSNPTGFILGGQLTDLNASSPASTPLPKPAIAGFGLFGLMMGFGVIGRRFGRGPQIA
jgi:hypothetical protein